MTAAQPDPVTESSESPESRGAVQTALVDLGARRLGAGVVSASDESFGDKEHLLTETEADFRPGTFDHRGEVVDGWETRRRRRPGHDWAVVRLGLPGVPRQVDVDTSFFGGNYPEVAWLEGCGLEGYPGPEELAAAAWEPLGERFELKGDAHNVVDVATTRRYTHLRLNVAPDGGVARLRVRGVPVLDPRPWDGLTVDLASEQLGARVIASSDAYYTNAEVLLRPDRARTMGEGWETRRRRDDGHDWATIRLAAAGVIRAVEVDTTHFKHNASSHVQLTALPDDGSAPHVLLARTALQPDTRHVLPLTDDVEVTTVRLDAFPDGGLSRLRLLGAMTDQAREDLALTWLNSLPTNHFQTVVQSGGVDPHRCAALDDARPFATVEDAVAREPRLTALLRPTRFPRATTRTP